ANNNGLAFTARRPGADLTLTRVILEDGGAGTKGAETATYDPRSNTLTIKIQLGAGGSTARDVVTRVRAIAAKDIGFGTNAFTVTWDATYQRFVVASNTAEEIKEINDRGVNANDSAFDNRLGVRFSTVGDIRTLLNLSVATVGVAGAGANNAD